MKRENEDNNYQDQQDPQQQMQSDENPQEQGGDQDDSQDGTNDTNNFNNQNNQDNNGNGGPNPPKRQRRNDDEEIRLLIPSKVQNFNILYSSNINLLTIFNFHSFLFILFPLWLTQSQMAGAVIGKGGHNIQKLRTEVCFDKISIHKTFFVFFCYSYLFRKTSLMSYFTVLPRTLCESPFHKRKKFKNIETVICLF